jgi:uncharacterized protein YndB with AHSA1/START domain
MTIVDRYTNADRELIITRVFDAPRELVWKAWTEPKMLATVVFIARGNKTEMTFRQRAFKSVEQRDSHQGGWASSFNRLAAYLAS